MIEIHFFVLSCDINIILSKQKEITYLVLIWLLCNFSFFTFSLTFLARNFFCINHGYELLQRSYLVFHGPQLCDHEYDKFRLLKLNFRRELRREKSQCIFEPKLRTRNFIRCRTFLFLKYRLQKYTLNI